MMASSRRTPETIRDTRTRASTVQPECVYLLGLRLAWNSTCDVFVPNFEVNEPQGMVRTQIHLPRAEQGFIATEAARRGETMAAVIRGCIDDKMRVPDTAWTANPMLEPTPSDDGLVLPDAAAINHDHHLWGTPKKYLKKRGKWVVGLLS